MMKKDIAHQRLLNQRIEGEPCQSPEEVVRWMGALQAQDYQQALWAVGLRTSAATVATIEQAIADRKILRTWPMRGTLHFVPSEDARWMLKLSEARMVARDKRRQEQLELDERITEQTKVVISNALAGGKQLTRQAMMNLLENAGISTTGQRGYHLLWYLAQTGLICLGPMQEKQQTFVLLDEWAPDAKGYSREESLARLAGRYAASHGPVTAHDFAHWAGLTLTEARAGLLMAQPELLSEKSEGQQYWRASETPEERLSPHKSMFLLPGFDEYLIGYKDRNAMLAAEHAPHIVPGGNGVFFPMVVVAGQIVGTWKRRIQKNTLDIHITLFLPVGDPEEELTQAAKQYSHFLGMPLSSTTITMSKEAEFHTEMQSRD